MCRNTRTLSLVSCEAADVEKNYGMGGGGHEIILGETSKIENDEKSGKTDGTRVANNVIIRKYISDSNLLR